MNNIKGNKLVYEGLLFVVIMVLTFRSIFRNQKIGEILYSIQKMPIKYMGIAVLLALLYVVGEGCMICFLLKKIGETTSVLRCVSYSFIGFFFSGITPSATGGQPMQLYCMKKDGNSISGSSVVLMTVAVVYKLVLVLIGIGILIFWNRSLKEYMGKYYGLYFLGLFLNIILVVILFFVMFYPQIIKSILCNLQKVLMYFRKKKIYDQEQVKINKFLNSYSETVVFLKHHKSLIGVILVGTFLQRITLFLLTYIVYCGLGLSTYGMLEIVLLQASIYVATDMLPLPGAQGITETIYKIVFQYIFPGSFLVVSMCITRGISFYFIMLVSFFVFWLTYFNKREEI